MPADATRQRVPIRLLAQSLGECRCYPAQLVFGVVVSLYLFTFGVQTSMKKNRLTAGTKSRSPRSFVAIIAHLAAPGYAEDLDFGLLPKLLLGILQRLFGAIDDRLRQVLLGQESILLYSLD